MGTITVKEKTALKKAVMPADRHIGHRVRSRRMMLGMSQTDLGDKVGVTFQQVQKYEKGTNRIGGSRMQQIAAVLNVPVGFFFEGLPATGGTFTIKDNPEAMLSGDIVGHRLAVAFFKISSTKKRRALVELAEAMTDDTEG